MSSKLMPVRRRGAEARVSDLVGMRSRLVLGEGASVGNTVAVSVDFMTDRPVPGDLDVRWIHGSPDRRNRTDPAVQVHPYDEHTVLLRQSKDVSFEAPFVFLLFGNERALLLDTGAVQDDTMRGTVDRLMDAWRARHHSALDYELVVAHTHGHGDHVAGDASFAGRANTTVVGRDVESVREFFGFVDWPASEVRFDLGGRVLELTGIPGHHPASLLVYDPWTGLLLTGDSVYPGRLYVSDFPAYVDSLRRTVDFAEARAVTHVLGCHIEMTRTPRRDYFIGCRYQPDEPPLQMTMAQLRAVRDAAAASADRTGVHRYDDFVIYNGMGPATKLRLLARALAGTAREKITSRR
jgi:hydroxyacylglutathione hydrolase